MIVSAAYANKAMSRGFVTIDQEILAGEDRPVGLVDIDEMVSYARSGLSARYYKNAGCPAEVDGDEVVISLNLYVHPYDMALDYEASLSLGRVKDKIEIKRPCSVDVVVPLSDTFSLPWLVEDVEIDWLTPAYNSWGKVVPMPTCEQRGNVFTFKHPFFGVARLNCNALGYHHPIEIRIGLVEGYSIKNIVSKFSVNWFDGVTAQQEAEDVNIPACVEALLATCEDEIKIRTLINPDGKKRTHVWYSDCTGKPLRIRSKRENAS